MKGREHDQSKAFTKYISRKPSHQQQRHLTDCRLWPCQALRRACAAIRTWRCRRSQAGIHNSCRHTLVQTARAALGASELRLWRDVQCAQPILAGTSDLQQAQKIFDLVGTPTEQNMPGWSSLPGCGGINQWEPRKGNLAQVFRECVEHTVLRRMADGRQTRLRRNRTSVRIPPPRLAKTLTAVDALSHPYFRNAPLPSKPHELPKYADSHELDRKKFREGKRAAAPPAPVGGTVGGGANGGEWNAVGPNMNGYNSGPSFARSSSSMASGSSVSIRPTIAGKLLISLLHHSRSSQTLPFHRVRRHGNKLSLARLRRTARLRNEKSHSHSADKWCLQRNLQCSTHLESYPGLLATAERRSSPRDDYRDRDRDRDRDRERDRDHRDRDRDRDRDYRDPYRSDRERERIETTATETEIGTGIADDSTATGHRRHSTMTTGRTQENGLSIHETAGTGIGSGTETGRTGKGNETDIFAGDIETPSRTRHGRTGAALVPPAVPNCAAIALYADLRTELFRTAAR
ncbi:hypothetical protein MRB53_038000 [Persea americana]|nr:hypothetical protein MRB53_038000 [Persea americana]